MIRPQLLKEFIGNPSARDQIRLVLDTVQKTGEAFPHVLFFGFPGTGKTTLANIIANELGVKVICITGNTVHNQEDLYRLLKDLFKDYQPGKAPILFIDEIAALVKSKDLDQTIWLPILEDFKFFNRLKGQTIDCDGEFWKITSRCLDMPPFTVIGATTDITELDPALVRRFPIQVYMNPYTIEELATIVSQAAIRNNMNINQGAALSIAKRSRFTPATAMTFLKHCWYWKMAKDAPEINDAVVVATMAMLKIDENGLKYEDLKVLNALGNNNKGLGLSNLAGVSGVQKDVIEKIIEPFLKEMGLMSVTTKRVITERGLEYITRPEAAHA